MTLLNGSSSQLVYPMASSHRACHYAYDLIRFIRLAHISVVLQ